MTPEERKRWSERLKGVCPIKVTDEYPGNPDYIETHEFEEMVDVIAAAVAEEREAIAEYVRTHAFASSSLAPHHTIVEHIDAGTETLAAAIRARKAGA